LCAEERAQKPALRMVELPNLSVGLYQVENWRKAWGFQEKADDSNLEPALKPCPFLNPVFARLASYFLSPY
jgi:hypothetical protein